MNLCNKKQQLGAHSGGEEINSNTKNITRLNVRTSADFTCN